MTTFDPIPIAIQKGANVPAFPVTAQRALSLLAKPEVDLLEISTVFASDQAFAARILSTVNSSWYPLNRTISDIHEAVAYLGTNETRKITYTMAAKAMFGSRQSFVSWAHALSTAYLCEALARQQTGLKPTDAFIAGLFHDVGKLFLQQYSPNSYSVVMNRAMAYNQPAVHFEKEIFKLDHTEVGQLLIQKWNLSDVVCRAVRYHHAVVTELSGFPLVVAIANRTAHLAENESDSRYQMTPEMLAHAGIDGQGVIAELIQEVNKRIKSFMI